jgi:glutaredoxin 3
MKAIVWSKYDCPFCDRAKMLLNSKGYEIEEKKIGDGYTKEDLLEAVPTARSVPQVFINNQLIGGFNELQKYIQDTTMNYGDGKL